MAAESEKWYVDQGPLPESKFKLEKVHLLQLCHKVTPGLYRFFVCQVLECLFVGRNDGWACTWPEGWQWACPRCGEPFALGGGALKATRCYMLPNRNKIVLGIWPATAEESALLGFMEATSELDTASAGNTLEHERMAQIMAVIQKQVLPVQFERLHMTAETQAKIEYINAHPSGKYKHPFRYDHLADGFMGMRLTGMGEVPIMSLIDFKTVLAMFARSMGVELVVNTVRCARRRRQRKG
jgi:hypothetical protein